jgi:hypothetical protein
VNALEIPQQKDNFAIQIIPVIFPVKLIIFDHGKIVAMGFRKRQYLISLAPVIHALKNTPARPQPVTNR